MKIIKIKGFSLVELMVTLSVAGVLAAAVVPSLGNLVMRHEMKNAQDSVAQTLRKAKHIARTQNTNIRVVLTQDSNIITILRPNNSVIQTINLAKVTVTASNTYQFNALGTVNMTGTITLVSDKDDAQTKTVTIDTLFGQITQS